MVGRIMARYSNNLFLIDTLLRLPISADNEPFILFVLATICLNQACGNCNYIR